MDLRDLLIRTTKIRDERKKVIATAKKTSALAQNMTKERNQVKPELGHGHMKISNMGEHNQRLSNVKQTLQVENAQLRVRLEYVEEEVRKRGDDIDVLREKLAQSERDRKSVV